MKNLTVAKRYAKALYQVSNETKTIDDVNLGFSNLKHALKEAPHLQKALLNPLVKPEEKQAVVKTVTSNKIINKFVFLLAKRKRLDLMNAIIDEFTFLVDADKGVNRVLVKSAVVMSDAQKKTFEKELAKKLGGHIVGQFEVAKELIGGIWVRLGDKVLDASVRGRFEDLKQHLLHSTN